MGANVSSQSTYFIVKAAVCPMSAVMDRPKHALLISLSCNSLLSKMLYNLDEIYLF